MTRRDKNNKSLFGDTGIAGHLDLVSVRGEHPPFSFRNIGKIYALDAETVELVGEDISIDTVRRELFVAFSNMQKNMEKYSLPSLDFDYFSIDVDTSIDYPSDAFYAIDVRIDVSDALGLDASESLRRATEKKPLIVSVIPVVRSGYYGGLSFDYDIKVFGIDKNSFSFNEKDARKIALSYLESIGANPEKDSNFPRDIITRLSYDVAKEIEAIHKALDNTYDGLIDQYTMSKMQNGEIVCTMSTPNIKRPDSYHVALKMISTELGVDRERFDVQTVKEWDLIRYAEDYANMESFDWSELPEISRYNMSAEDAVRVLDKLGMPAIKQDFVCEEIIPLISKKMGVPDEMIDLIQNPADLVAYYDSVVDAYNKHGVSLSFVGETSRDEVEAFVKEYVTEAIYDDIEEGRWNAASNKMFEFNISIDDLDNDALNTERRGAITNESFSEFHSILNVMSKHRHTKQTKGSGCRLSK